MQVRSNGFFAIFLALLTISIIFSGCLQKIGGSGSYTSDYASNLNRIAAYSPEDIEIARKGSCWCMVCTNGTGIFGDLKSLIHGSCYFEKSCDTQKTSELVTGKAGNGLSIRPLMIGQGPTIADFATANTYCSDRLSMAVQWLIGDKDRAYTLPDPQRSMCLLSKDVMPVYIMYSKSENIDIAQSAEVGRILGHDGKNLFAGKLTNGPVGPVVIVTEIDFNKNKAGEVANQVLAIDGACGNDREKNKIYCQIAVAPKINDFEALDAVMNSLKAKGGKSALDKVDFIAYGINGRNVQSCDGAKILEQARNFSSYALYNWSKPSIIPYIMFDTSGNDSINSCTWNENYMVSAYSAFWPLGIQTLQSRGVVGIAPYTFNSSSYGYGALNPLGCKDCALAKNTFRLSSWFSGCQAYTNKTRGTEWNPTGQTPIIFGNESATVCNQNKDYSYLGGFAFGNGDILQPGGTQLKAPTDKYFACDACLVTNFSSKQPFNFGYSNPPIGFCTKYPEIDEWASARNIDPNLVRAIIMKESNFNNCAVGTSCSAEYKKKFGGSGCLDSGSTSNDPDYSIAYTEMHNPDPVGTNCTYNADLVTTYTASSTKPDHRYGSVGLMQSLEPPYTYWPAEYSADGKDGQYIDILNTGTMWKIGNMALAKTCNPQFNPFSASDSICVGTAKVEIWLRQGHAWINSHRSQLNWPTSDYERDNVFAAYIAMNKYAGFWDAGSTNGYHTQNPDCTNLKNGDCWAMGFANSWKYDDAYCSTPVGEDDDEHCAEGKPRKDKCYGYTDFVDYVDKCERPYFSGKDHDPGKSKMAAYFGFQKTCAATSFCPDGKKIYDVLGKPIPPSGTPYIK